MLFAIGRDGNLTAVSVFQTGIPDVPAGGTEIITSQFVIIHTQDQAGSVRGLTFAGVLHKRDRLHLPDG